MSDRMATPEMAELSRVLERTAELMLGCGLLEVTDAGTVEPSDFGYAAFGPLAARIAIQDSAYFEKIVVTARIAARLAKEDEQV